MKTKKKNINKKRQTQTFISIEKLLKKKRLPFELPVNPITPFDINNYTYLKEIDLVIEKIKSIANNPRTHIIANKEPKKIETVIRIDNSDLQETTQREKLWKEKAGKALPERMFSDEFETNLAIYENRFIVSLINKTFSFVNAELRNLYNCVGSISNNYQMKDSVSIASAADHAKLTNVIAISYNVKNYFKKKTFLTKSDTSLDNVIKHFLEIRQQLTHVMAGKFYKTVKQAKSLGDKDIHPTNILMGDSTYAPCYDFYLKLKRVVNKTKRANKINTVAYKNYVIYVLLGCLRKMRYTFTTKSLKMVKNEIKLNNFRATNKGFKLSITSKPRQLVLNFRATLKNKSFIKTPTLKLKTSNKISLDLLPNISTSLSSLLVEAIIARRLNQEYNDAYVITSQASIANDSIVICNPYNEKADLNILNMLKAVTLLTEGDEFIYTHLCPVCGNPVVLEEDKGNYVCPICASTYSIIKTKTKKKTFDLVWIKNIKGRG